MQQMQHSPKFLELLDRIERCGGVVERSVPTRNFSFTLSGIVTPGVDIKAFIHLCELVTSLAEQRDFICELASIVMFPIITDPAIYSRADFMVHKRKDSGYFVGRNLDIEVWKRARKARRAVLASEALKSAIEAIPNKHLSIESKIQLVEIIDSASNHSLH
jgi:hypothetical protein